MHVPFIDMSIVQSYKKARQEGRLASSQTKLRTDGVLREGVALCLCYGDLNLKKSGLSIITFI